MAIFDYQNSDNTFKIQDNNYVAVAVDGFYNNFIDCFGMLPKTTKLVDKGISYYKSDDKNIRVPGHVKFKSAKTANILTNADTLYQLDSAHLYILGNYANTSIKTTEILNYTPRLYAQLVPLADLIQTAINAGCTQFWTAKYMFGLYDTPPYGYSFIPLDTTLISSLTGQYALVYYAMYTNNFGAEQTMLAENNGSAVTDYYDTFIPFIGQETGTAKVAKGKLLMLPYIRQFISRKFNGTIYGWLRGLQSQEYNYLIGQAGGLGDIDGLLWSGINHIVGTTAGDISPNPFMYSTSSSTSYDNWANLMLKTSPANGVRYSIITADLDTWAKIFNGSGMAWSYDLDKVIAPDDSGLNKPTIPGQPDNPVDDGDGDGDNISDGVTYPTVGYTPTAARYMYALTDSKVKDTSNYLFSQTFLDDVRRLWTNPGDYIIDLSYYPVNFAESRLTFAPALDGSPVYIGNLNSGVIGKEIVGGSTAIYGGYVDITNYYNSYLDYAPNTSISIYIPYIGVRPLDIDLVTGHRVHLMYYLDLGTGQFIAALGLDGDISQDELGRFSGSIGKPLAQYCGNMAIHIPLNGTSQNAYILNSAVQATQILTSAGALAGGVATGNIAGVVGGAGGVVGAVKSPIIKEEVQGTLTPATGLYSPQTAYLIINRPKTAEPSTFKDKQGYTSCYAGTVSNFTGFLQCAAVEIPATGTMTEEEQQEIINLLTGGIYCG